MIGSTTAAGSTTSLSAKTGPSRLNGSAAGVSARTDLVMGSGLSAVCGSACAGSKLGFILRAPRGACRQAASSSTSWRSRTSARVSPNKSGRMRPVTRCEGPAPARIPDVTASAAGRCGMGSGGRIAGTPSPGCVGRLTGTEGVPNSSWSARRCRWLGELSAVVTVRGTRLLFRFTSTVNDGFAR